MSVRSISGLTIGLLNERSRSILGPTGASVLAPAKIASPAGAPEQIALPLEAPHPKKTTGQRRGQRAALVPPGHRGDKQREAQQSSERLTGDEPPGQLPGKPAIE